MKKYVLFFLTIFVLCGSCSKKTVHFDNEQGLERVFSISQSSLNRDSTVSITFYDDIKTSSIQNCVKWSTPIDGSWELIDAKTITFTPSAFLPSDTHLELTVDVGKLFGEAANKIGFTEKFYVNRAFFLVHLDYPVVDKDNDDMCSIDMTVTTDIAVPVSDISACLEAELEGKKYNITYDRLIDKTEHSFKITNIEKKTFTQALVVRYDAKNIGIDASGNVYRDIPAKDVFTVLDARMLSGRTVQFTFSENLNAKDDIRQFIQVTAPDTNFTYTWRFDKNTLSFTCSRNEWPADTEISILERFKSAKGTILENAYTYRVVLGWDKPSVSFIDSKVIIPSQGKPIVSIMTKNISGVVVEALQIQQSNMLQFLQINDLDQSYEMSRVGQSVWQKAFDFDWNENMKNRYITRGLDLSELAKKYPDGMFQLRVTFAKRHSKYEGYSGSSFAHLEFPSDFINFERYPYDAYWDSVESTPTYNFGRYYNDPNHPAYYISSYNSSVIDSRNALISNLVISAKVDALGNAYIQAINLITGEPEKNAEIKIFNYAQNLLEEGNVDSNGRYAIKEKSKNISFIQAKSANNYAYIRLTDAPLSTSNFQVDGIRTTEGIKGFVYGERGVWRPGDTLHLCLIIQDLQNTIPTDLPIVFTLEDPMGKVVDKQVLTEQVNGFYKVTTQTSEADATGSWIARFKTGNNVWTKTLKIESIIPNKLAIDLQVANGFFNSGNNAVTLNSEWLTGVRASGLKSEIYSRYISSYTSFPSYTDYIFTDVEYNTSTSLSKIWEGNLDTNGGAHFNLKLDAGKNVSGMLKAIFETRVYEPSGAFSIETKTFDFSPFSRYVGFKLPKSNDSYRDVLYVGEEHTVDVVLVDDTGKLITTNADLEVSIYKLDWRWWWVRDAYTDASYDESRSTIRVLEQNISTRGGKTSFTFSLDQWGRYLFMVRDPQTGHKASHVIYADYSYWATRSNTDVTGSSNMLLLTVNQDTYSVNENAEITFNANQNATAYITVEKNGMIIQQDIVKTVDGTNVWEFKTTGDMAPNVYVHVSLVQSFAKTSNSLPVRMYGIVPVAVEDKETHLQPVITVPASYTPNQVCTLSVSEKTGKPSTFTIAVVDEGLLGLTAFKTTDPWSHFYSKESSQLTSYDMFNYVAGSKRGELQTLITVGGSDENEQIASKTAERFKPVVFYFGPFELKKGEKKELQFTMPEYIGEVRVMAVCGDNRGFGVAEEKVKVKTDIMLSPTLPRTLGVDETIELPVTVFNTTDKQKQITVELETKGSTVIKKTERIQLAAQSNGIVSFTIMPTAVGTTQIDVTAKDGNKIVMKSTNEISVKPRGLPYEDIQVFAVRPGEKIDARVQTVGINGSKQLAVEVAKNTPLGIEKQLNYLLDYPHGCIEQITSKAFAQLYIHKLLTLTDDKIADIKNSVMSVINRYAKYQISSGGMGYWQGDSFEHLWGSVYALHFLIEAKNAGYNVDTNVYNRLVNRIVATTQSFSSYTEYYGINCQAYRLYVLALIGKANVGAMNRLLNISEMSVYARILLSLAYVSSGNRSQGQKIFDGISSDFPSYRQTGGDFSSSIRDLSMMCFAAAKLSHTSAASRLMALSDAAKQSWLSTQEAAWLLIAASQFVEKYGAENVSYELVSGSERINNELETYAEVHQLPVSDGAQTISLKNNGASLCFVTVRYNSIVTDVTDKPRSNALDLNVTYIKDGNATPLTSIRFGDTFTVRHTIKNITKTNIDNLVLQFQIPTGWEISNERLAGEVATTNYSYIDIRDDMIYVHFNLSSNETKTFDFVATATYSGTYFVPPSVCEAMYDYNIRTHTLGEKLTAHSE